MDREAMDVDKGAVRQALNGNLSALSIAFYWRHAPQGAGYWSERSSGEIPLSAEDRAFLQSLLTDDASETDVTPTRDSQPEAERERVMDNQKLADEILEIAGALRDAFIDDDRAESYRAYVAGTVVSDLFAIARRIEGEVE